MVSSMSTCWYASRFVCSARLQKISSTNFAEIITKFCLYSSPEVKSQGHSKVKSMFLLIERFELERSIQCRFRTSYRILTFRLSRSPDRYHGKYSGFDKHIFMAHSQCARCTLIFCNYSEFGNIKLLYLTQFM